jgi:DNA-binding IclR family transcriptional regulator
MGLESNKAKIAKRVIEVLDFFDDQHREATVMDIVRRYNRPQSSTSELLASLVDLGLLFKDPYTRSYSLSPRASLMGSIAQPELIRTGKVNELVDRLAAQTGLTVAVLGMVGLNVQIFSFKSGTRAIRTSNPKGVSCGLQESLAQSAAGWLLLSTIAQPRRDGVVRRLNAEAPEALKFSTSELSAQLVRCIEQGSAQGPAGFGAEAEIACALVTPQADGQPLVVGFIYEPSAQIDQDALLVSLRDGIARMKQPVPLEIDNVQRLASVG